jgi:LPS-assembly protein
LLRLGILLYPAVTLAQIYTSPFPALPPQETQASPDPDKPVPSTRSSAPDSDHYFIEAVTQEVDGPWRRLRGRARLESTEMQLKADEVDYNADTGYVEARGHVHFEHFIRGEKLDCDKAEYNIEEQTGKFYTVSGSAPSRIQARPGLLSTQNPFYFQGKWAERLKDHYILHDGLLTDCLIPKPWWILRGPTFDIVPGERAIAHNSWFYLKRLPLFYTPFFYKSLKKEPRKSGFLIPNIGNSSVRGKMVGMGYYWAINRSYDLTYRVQLFSQVGFAHNVDLRGKISRNTDFDAELYTLKDTRNLTPSQSGALITIHAKSELGQGWQARGELNYLSSLAFRQHFTESFNEAVFSETHSVGVITRHWSDFGFNFVAQRNVNFQTTAPNDAIAIRKLPEAQFVEREHEVDIKQWPFWFSFDSSAGLERRSQLLFQTRQFVPRLDFAPHVSTAFRWLDLELIPTFGIRETFYDSSLANGALAGGNAVRNSRDVNIDLILPSLERVFGAPKWMGDKVKHVIEPRVTYTYVNGISNFGQIIRFDETDLLTNTNQVEFSLTNRLLAKDHNGTVTDFLSWQLWYQRYFDPTFGGAIVPGQRNVIQSSVDLTGYAFLDGLRHQSPVVSALRVQSRVGLEWRMDYDPVRHAIVNSSVAVDGRFSNKYFFSAGHTDLKADPVLAPTANQFRGVIGYGGDNNRGWNFGFSAYYDYRKGVLQYSQTQITYNTDCCGFSVQYRRFAFGTRYENQFRVAFAISNIGTFGTLKRQERIF